MTPMTWDPVVFGECSVIISCLAFVLWQLSPSQRRKERLAEARDRRLLRRAFLEPMDGTGCCNPVPSTSTQDSGRPVEHAQSENHCYEDQEVDR